MKKMFVFLLIILSTCVFGNDLPSKYNNDINNLLYMTKVKEQEGGTCWAFAATACMETYTLKKYNKSVEFSPMDLYRNNPYPKLNNDSGNYFKVMPYLANLWGPVLNNDKNLNAIGYCENCQVISDDVNGWTEKELKDIKNVVYKNGSCVANMYMDQFEYFDKNEYNYHCPNNYKINHTILIVGWDDNYPKENFKIQPKNDGAFLIKNSWGDKVHNKGYFWLPYEEKSVNDAISYDFILKDNCNYNKHLTYCYSTPTQGFYYSLKYTYGKVIYKTTTSNKIYALRAYVYEADTNLTCSIYVNGKLREIVSDYLDFKGYKTIYLNDSINFNMGDEITLILKYECKDKSAKLPLEKSIYGYTPGIFENTNFESHDGKEWKELSENNIGIGLLVGNGDFTINAHEINGEKEYGYTLKAYYKNQEVKPIWKSLNEKVATVDENGSVTVLNSGYADIIAEYNGFKDCCEFYIKY